MDSSAQAPCVCTTVVPTTLRADAGRNALGGLNRRWSIPAQLSPLGVKAEAGRAATAVAARVMW